MFKHGAGENHFPLIKCLGTGLFAALFYFFLAPQPANAYIDPGTGGMIIQGLIGLLAGALAMLGIFWKRVTLSIKNLFKKKTVSTDETEYSDKDKQ